METPSTPEACIERPSRIAELNDLLRQTFLSTLGKVVTTSGIQSLGEPLFEEALAAVCNFDAFTSDNDPHGEHDFGAVSLTDGTRIFWKIDYYDKNMQFASEDPADVTKTVRVLTIMRAEEY